MKKAGFYVFICSFLLSLSAIFAADKFFLRPSRENHDDLVISNKNIVLFINDAPQKPVRALPTKKISLSVLPEIAHSLPETPPLKVAASEESAVEESVILADAGDDGNYDFSYIPLDIEVSVPNNHSENFGTTASEAPADTAVSEPKVIEKRVLPPKFEDKNINKIVVVKKEPAPAEAKIASRADRSLSESRPQDLSAPSQAEASEQPPLLLAAAEDNEPMLLIPLERSKNSEFAGQNMQINTKHESNQVAAADKNVPVKSLGIPAKSADDGDIAPVDGDNVWTSMAELKAEKRQAEKKTAPKADEAWAVAKGRDHPKNSLILEADTNKSEAQIQQVLSGGEQAAANRSGEIQIAGEMIDNLLIPIPQDILNDDNLTPQLASSEENKILERELDEEIGIERAQDEEQENDVKILDAQGRDIRKKEGGLLSSITSIFSGSDDNKSTEEDGQGDDSSIIANITRKMSGKKAGAKILPTEIRLSFQPNRAEISGATLQWIQAFGKKAAEEAGIALEIRLNGNSDHILQQKRLNLLSNILTGRGVDGNKIKVVYTLREPNSFVMRTIRINEQTDKTTMKNNTTSASGYYLQW